MWIQNILRNSLSGSDLGNACVGFSTLHVHRGSWKARPTHPTRPIRPDRASEASARASVLTEYREARPMDPSILHPVGFPGSPSGVPYLRDATDSGPTPGATEEGPRQSRIGISRLPWWNRKWIGLLLLGLIGLPFLPVSCPPGDARPSRQARGVGDLAILTFAFAPD